MSWEDSNRRLALHILRGSRASSVQSECGVDPTSGASWGRDRVVHAAFCWQSVHFSSLGVLEGTPEAAPWRSLQCWTLWPTAQHLALKSPAKPSNW